MVQEKKSFKDLSIYSNGGHIGWLFDTILTNLKGANGEMLDVKYHPIWSSRLREEVDYVQS